VRRIESYKIKRGDDLGSPDTWNQRFDDLDLRLHTAELERDSIDQAVEALEAAALQRLNDTLTPIINDAIEALQNIGVAFEAQSNDALTVSLGEKTVIITPDTRGQWIVTNTIVISSADGEAAMLGEPVSYDRTNGVLVVDVLATTGTGPRTGWKLGVSAPLDIDHATRIDNPHLVTAEQVGAFKKTVLTTPGAVPAPGDLSSGEMAINTADGRVFTKKDNGTIIPIGKVAAVSETAPVNPDPGDLWFDTADGSLMLYYNDGNTSQWVQVTDSNFAYLRDGSYGDVAASNGGTTLTVANNAISNAKLADVATSTIKGRVSAGSGDPEDLTAAQARQVLGVREALTGARTYYVRTDGSNSNNGLTNTPGGAFLTLQGAYDAICRTIDTAGYTVTVQIGDGTYTTPLSLTIPWVGGGQIIFQGNVVTPANVLISTTSANCVSSTSMPLAGAVTFRGMEFRTTTGGNCIYATMPGGRILVDTVRFGACAVQHLFVVDGACIEVIGPYTISGGAANHIEARNGGTYTSINRTITLSGTPAFTTFALAQFNGQINFFNTTFSGAATGQRYISYAQSLINTFGAGTSHLPGNSAGTADAATFALYL
jgi:hypothetical protein